MANLLINGRHFLKVEGDGTEQDPFVIVTGGGSGDSEREITSKVLDISNDGANEIIAAPGAGKRIVLIACMVQNIDEDQNVTVTVTDGEVDFVKGVLKPFDGIAVGASDGRVLKLGDNKPLSVFTSGAIPCTTTTHYYIEG